MLSTNTGANDLSLKISDMEEGWHLWVKLLLKI